MVRLRLLSRNRKSTMMVDEQYYNRQFEPISDPKPLKIQSPSTIESPEHNYPHSSQIEGLTGFSMNAGPNPQHYCLRWNNHQHNLLGVLESVLASQQHADVSLFCEGHVLRVHKLVLLASSSHFERILEVSPSGQQPFIILDGTKIEDLRALVDYMYRGQVNVDQEQLPSLLKTADTLKIKGLTDVVNKDNDENGRRDNTRDREHRATPTSMLSPPAKRTKSSSSEDLYGKVNGGESRDVQSEPKDLSKDSHETQRDSHFGISSSAPYAASHQSSHHMPTSSSMTPVRSLLYSASLTNRNSSKSPVSNLTAPYLPNDILRSRSPHYDTSPGSSLPAPRSSPHSPVRDHGKMSSHIGLPPFGLPFTLPLLHESKKILDRSNHRFLTAQYESMKEESNKEYRNVSWARRVDDYDLEKVRELRDREYPDRDIKDKDWLREREKNNDLNDRTSLSHQQDQVTQSQNYRPQQARVEAQPSLPSPVQQQPHSQLSTPLPRLEIVEKPDSDADRRHDDDKFSESPDKSSTFSPPDDINSVSSKTELTPEGGHPEDEEESINGGVRDVVTSNGEITSSITSTGSNEKEADTGVSQQNMVKCPYCPRFYRHQNNLRTHIRCFHKGVRIPCPICNRGFTRWFTVRCHIAREHQNIDFTQPDNLPVQLRRAMYPQYNE